MDPSLLDILWILICAFLVLLMQAGFLCVETGLTRSKNNINVAVKNSVDFAVSLIAFWAVGYSVMFGEWLPGVMGPLAPAPYDPEDPFFSAFFLFQAMFCSTAVTIVSGIVAERIRFGGYIILSLILGGLIYPLVGHWIWNGADGGTGVGWLAEAGFVDWAGSTVVHSLGGWFGLALLLNIGPRAGRFGPDGQVREITGANLPMTALGVLILWFGWLGFNGGSTLALTATIVPVIVNTCVAAAAGGVAALLWDWRRTGTAHVMPPLNGILAGLVGITACAHALIPSEAILVGGVAGILAFQAERALLRFKIDDAVSGFAIHTAAGIWGTLSVALFGDPALLDTGLTFWAQIKVQLLGIAACWVIGFLIPFLLLRVTGRWLPLRVTPEEEEMGLNVAEHGARTELHDFFEVLSQQAHSGDLSLRVDENPFTEIGQVGGYYNRVMDTLEEAISKIDAIVRSSADAILTFSPDGAQLHSCNPAARRIFGLPDHAFGDIGLCDLAPGLHPGVGTLSHRVELDGVRGAKKKFPIEAMVVEAKSRSGAFLIGVFRDITQRKEAEQSLRESEARFRTVFENAALGMALVNDNLEIVDANPALLKMLGFSREESLSTSLCGIAHQEDLAQIIEPLKSVLNDQQLRHVCEVRCICRSQLMIWARLAFSKFHVADCDGPLAIVIVEDITEQKRYENALRLSASVFESTTEPIVIFKADGLISQANAAFRRAFGFDARQVRGLKLRHLASARYDDAFFDKLEERLFSEGVWQGEIMGRRADQTLMPLWVSFSMLYDDRGQLQNRIAILTDLSEQKEREETIWRHANFDQLTDLPNRRLFQDRLEQSLGLAQRRSGKVGIFFIDLDRFKLVNDTLGHQAGDELLQKVAQRLQVTVRSTDTVARLGGDEFTVILQNFKKNEELAWVARNIIAEVEKPLMLEAGEASISASIGIAVFPDDGADSEALIRSADTALYQAKDSGRNNYQFFTQELNQALMKQVNLERMLRQAIANGELFMVYQPQLETCNGEIPSAEALIRWRDNEGNLIPPDEFIPLAEETGLIIPLGNYVIRAVCRDIRRWLDAGYECPRIALNASAKQLHFEQGLPYQLQTICREERVPLELISVEITENSLMANQKQSLEVLEELSAMGISLALDDFGTGYSSLSRLKRLPLSTVKLDRSFIMGIPDERENTALVNAVAQMAQALDLTVVAEGVETERQLEYLRGLGCDKIQGFLISRPIPADEFIEFPRLHSPSFQEARKAAGG